MTIIFERRTDKGVISSSDPANVFPDWKNSEERWLFVAPHDDDIVCGAGLTFVSAVESGIETYAIVTTTGEAGYCRPEHKGKIAQIRREEAKKSFSKLGLPAENLILFDYPDGFITPYLGHRLTVDTNDSCAIAGATGYQNSFTWALRKIKPSRVFLPSQTDIHPDHKAVHEQFVMSVFHAQGNIWPELGEPTPMIPLLYEYATYCDFLTPPTIRVKTSPDMLERKIDGILAYASQEQISLLVDVQRNCGPQEYIRELEFNVLQPQKYAALFE
ncbi:MAG: PIG-L deacetylase family protein [Thermoguttaceae bacterium]